MRTGKRRPKRPLILRLPRLDRPHDAAALATLRDAHACVAVAVDLLRSVSKDRSADQLRQIAADIAAMIARSERKQSMPPAPDRHLPAAKADTTKPTDTTKS